MRSTGSVGGCFLTEYSIYGKYRKAASLRSRRYRADIAAPAATQALSRLFYACIATGRSTSTADRAAPSLIDDPSARPLIFLD